VVVIAIDGDPDVAIWGGLMTAGAYARNLAGAILDAGVRDIPEIRRDYDFPVISRSVCPGTTLGRYKTLAANVPVVCGGVEVRPGDIVVGDVDGVVVVPRDRAAEVLEMAIEIDKRELEQAKLIVEARSLKQGLAKYGRI
jgi:regulator of RNase E activity RraA